MEICLEVVCDGCLLQIMSLGKLSMSYHLTVCTVMIGFRVLIPITTFSHVSSPHSNKHPYCTNTFTPISIPGLVEKCWSMALLHNFDLGCYKTTLIS